MDFNIICFPCKHMHMQSFQLILKKEKKNRRLLTIPMMGQELCSIRVICQLYNTNLCHHHTPSSVLEDCDWLESELKTLFFNNHHFTISASCFSLSCPWNVYLYMYVHVLIYSSFKKSILICETRNRSRVSWEIKNSLFYQYFCLY